MFYFNKFQLTLHFDVLRVGLDSSLAGPWDLSAGRVPVLCFQASLAVSLLLILQKSPGELLVGAKTSFLLGVLQILVCSYSGIKILTDISVLVKIFCL